MRDLNDFPKVSLGLLPTPLCHLDKISNKYGKDIWIKRDDLCGVALGGNKVRKLEYLLGQAKAEGADCVFTTGQAQSNHAMLTAACAARLGMKCFLYLKKRGVTKHLGNLVLNDIYGAEVVFFDTDSYDEIYDAMRVKGKELEKEGHKSCYIPCGGSTALGALGYVQAVQELQMQAQQASFLPGAIVSPTGSGGTSAGLLLGAKLFAPDTDVYGVAVDSDPFESMVPRLAGESAALLECDAMETVTGKGVFSMLHNWGAGYAIANANDTPYMEELARMEGILLDPVYSGKAWSGMIQAVENGKMDAYEHIVFFHTGGAAALFAIDLG